MMPPFNPRVKLRMPAILRDWISAVDDQWTWTVQDGRVYENVEIEALEQDHVVLQHSHGSARLLLSDLSEDSLQRLHETSFWLGRQTAFLVVDESAVSTTEKEALFHVA
jgi:hypothetical protein